MRSLGSGFKNPPGDRAGRLVEAAGLKGHRVGGAQISPKHANFIVNVDHATAGDVVNLIQTAIVTVLRRFSSQLGRAILASGEFSRHCPSEFTALGEFSLAGFSAPQLVFGLEDESLEGKAAAITP